jgi:hypothetical protein
MSTVYVRTLVTLLGKLFGLLLGWVTRVRGTTPVCVTRVRTSVTKVQIHCGQPGPPPVRHQSTSATTLFLCCVRDL